MRRAEGRGAAGAEAGRPIERGRGEGEARNARG
jgi:hypothetical protein